MKKNLFLLLSVVLGMLYFLFAILLIYVIPPIDSSLFLVTLPHLILLLLALILNGIALGQSYTQAAFAGAVLYCLSACLMPFLIVFELPSILLSFLGFFQLRRAKRGESFRDLF